MKNRALIGLSAAAMSALVVTAVGCGQPTNPTYEPEATEAATTATTEETTTGAAESAKAESEPAADEKAAPAESAAADKAESASADAEADEPAVEPAGAYADGEYTGEAKGMESTIKVTVTVEGGVIADLQAEGQETEGIGTKALEQLPALIVEANGTEGVDAIAGASVTSKAIFAATDAALESAAGGEAAPAADAEPAAESSKADEPAAAAKADSAKADKAESTKAEAAPAKSEKADEPAAAGELKDGTYEGTGKGMGGDVPVTVTVEGGKIASVEVGENSETQGIGTKAIEQLPAKIVEANGVEGVDAISGATVTSKAIFSAVEEALASDAAPVAAAGKAEPAAESAEADKAESAAESSKADEPAAAAKADKAESAKAEGAKAEAAPAKSEKAESAKVETKASAKSDAKSESKAASSAKDKAASSKADSAAGELKDGTYEGTGKGMGGDVPVTVTVEGGKIASVEVGENSETQGIGTKAIEQLPAKIVEANGVEGVDAISGATVTSKAIFSAVEEALA